MSRRSRILVLACAALALVAVTWAGCAGDGSGIVDDMINPPDPPDPPTAPTLDELQASIFGLICTECHFPGGPGPMPLDSADATFQNLVGVQSVEIGTLLRVEAGNAENSYLVHKIEGQASIVGTRMPPPPRPSLTDEQIADIRAWIDAGAAR